MRLGRAVPLLCLVSALAAAPLLARQAAPAAATQDVASVIDRTFSAWNVPGASVAVVKDGQVLLTKGYGVREIGKPGRVDDQTIFYTASVTKTFTVTAIGMLGDEGRLRIDEPVAKYLPAFSAANTEPLRQATLRDLISHRTGLPRADLLMFSGLSEDEVLARVTRITPVAPLRSRFTYQNQMYLGLGQIISRLSGKSWQEFIETRLLAPLGMAGSNAAGLGHPPSGAPGAVPHALSGNSVAPVEYVPRAPYGAGGVNTSARDLGRWLQFELGDGTWNGTKLVAPQVLQAMQLPNTIVQPTIWTPRSTFMLYGLGWFLSDDLGRKVVQHGGNGEGWTALVWMLPQEKLGVAVLTNMHNTLMPWAIAHAVADTVAPGPVPARDWTAHFLSAERARDTAAAKQRPQPGAGKLDPGRWVGTWTSPIYGDVLIGAGSDGLELSYGPNLRATIGPLGDDAVATWRRSDILAVVGPSMLRQATRDGVARLQLVLGGDTLEFTRSR